MMKWLLAITCFILLCFFIKKNKLFKTAYPGPAFMIVIFLLKFLCGLLVGWVYTSYYHGGDTFSYLHDANVIQNLLMHHPVQYLEIITGINANDPALQPVYMQMHFWNDSGFSSLFTDSRTFIRLNAIIRLFSLGYYEVHVLLMSFISLCGLMMMYTFAKQYSPKKEKYIALVIFCTPSLLFWGSGLMKESLQLFAMGFVLYQFQKLTLALNARRILFFIVSMLLLLLTRNYIFFCFIPGLIAWGIYHRYKKINCILLFSSCYGLLLIAAFQLKYVSPRFDIAQVLYDMQIVYWKNAVFYPAGSLIDRVPFAPSAISVIKRSPEAFWLTLSQPYLWECKNALYYFSSIENLIFIFLLALMFLRPDKNELKTNPLLAFSLCFAVVLFVIIGLTTPVVGSIVRYKVPALLFLGMAIVTGMKRKVKV